MWLWVLVVVIAAGLPAAAWGLNKRLRPPGAKAHGSEVDRWLREHYGLTTLERWEIEAALGDGKPLDRPQLQEAAQAAADEIRRGRLRHPSTPSQIYGRVTLVLGALMVGTPAIGALAGQSVGRSGSLLAGEGAFYLLMGMIIVFWLPRRMHRNLARISGQAAGNARPH